MLAINSDDVYGAKMMSGGGTLTLVMIFVKHEDSSKF